MMKTDNTTVKTQKEILKHFLQSDIPEVDAFLRTKGLFHDPELPRFVEEFYRWQQGQQEAVSSESESLWTFTKYQMPDVGKHLLVELNYYDHGKPVTETFVGYLHKTRDLYSLSTDESYGWEFAECVTRWMYVAQLTSKERTDLKQIREKLGNAASHFAGQHWDVDTNPTEHENYRNDFVSGGNWILNELGKERKEETKTAEGE